MTKNCMVDTANIALGASLQELHDQTLQDRVLINQKKKMVINEWCRKFFNTLIEKRAGYLLHCTNSHKENLSFSRPNLSKTAESLKLHLLLEFEELRQITLKAFNVRECIHNVCTVHLQKSSKRVHSQNRPFQLLKLFPRLQKKKIYRRIERSYQPHALS